MLKSFLNDIYHFILFSLSFPFLYKSYSRKVEEMCTMIEKKTLKQKKKNAALKIIQTFIVEFKVSPGHVDE